MSNSSVLFDTPGPKAIVRQEVDNLRRMGVEFETDVVVGRTVTVDELFGLALALGVTIGQLLDPEGGVGAGGRAGRVPAVRNHGAKPSSCPTPRWLSPSPSPRSRRCGPRSTSAASAGPAVAARPRMPLLNTSLSEAMKVCVIECVGSGSPQGLSLVCCVVASFSVVGLAPRALRYLLSL